MKRHGRQLERQPDHHHQASQRQHHRPVAEPAGLHKMSQLRSHCRQMARAEHARQQTDAVEHYTGRSRAVDSVFQGRLAALGPSLQHSGQRVGWNARHLDSQKDREQMVGRGHDAEAERRPEQQRIKVGPVFFVRDAGEPRQQNQRHGKKNQQRAEIERQRVVDQHAGEEFMPHNLPVDQQPSGLQPGERDNKPDHRADQRDHKRVEPLPAAEHPEQQHQHDRCAEHKLGAERRQTDRRRIAQQRVDQLR